MESENDNEVSQPGKLTRQDVAESMLGKAEASKAVRVVQALSDEKSELAKLYQMSRLDVIEVIKWKYKMQANTNPSSLSRQNCDFILVLYELATV